MKKLNLEREQRSAAVDRIRRYFIDELEQPIGVMPAERLLEFFAEVIGSYYYNQGLADAQAVFAKAQDDVNDRIYSLEQRQGR